MNPRLPRPLDGGPGFSAALVVPDDEVNLPGGRCRWLEVNTDGDVKVLGLDGEPVLFRNRASGTTLWFSTIRVLTGTTAEVVAVY